MVVVVKPHLGQFWANQQTRYSNFISFWSWPPQTLHLSNVHDNALLELITNDMIKVILIWK